MPNVNIASLTPALKELYEGPIVKAINDETIFSQRIDSSSKGVRQTAGGKYVDFPIQVGRNQGISFRQENETLGDPGRARRKEVAVPLFYGYGRCRIQGQIFEIAETDRQSFVDAIDDEMNVLRDSVKKDQNRIYYGDGTGRLATVATTMGAPGLTFIVDDAKHLEVDAVIDITTSAGTLLAGARNITAVDYDTKSVTVDGANFTATATTHFLTRAGNFTGGQQREPDGMAKITDNTVSLYGLNDPKWKATVRNVASANLSENDMIRVMDDIRVNTGDTPTVIFTSLGVRRAYFNLLVQQRRFNNTMEFSGGFKGLPFQYGSKDVPIVEDPDIPAGRMYFVPEKLMRVYHTGDWKFEDKTGSMFVQVANVDAFDVLMKRYFELGIRKRNAVGALIGINEN